MIAPVRGRFDAEWRETATLTDGTDVVLRLVRPADRDLLRAGFDRLSPESRYLRFFAAKQELTEAELARLTDLDGVDHLAIGAVRERPDGGWEGLGVARFVRDPSAPDMAEAAVTVMDAVQGRGLGRLLLARLAEAARERGITRFAGEFLATNAQVRQLIEEACPDARLHAAGDLIRVEVPLLDAEAPRDPAQRLLRQAAGGRLQLRLRHLLLKGSGGSL
jgi:GNAT superfamily N-acetyltransferase